MHTDTARGERLYVRVGVRMGGGAVCARVAVAVVAAGIGRRKVAGGTLRAATMLGFHRTHRGARASRVSCECCLALFNIVRICCILKLAIATIVDMYGVLSLHQRVRIYVRLYVVVVIVGAARFRACWRHTAFVSRNAYGT